MSETSKEILKQYVSACNRYEEEKKNNAVNPKVGNLSTFNQCTILRSKLIRKILEENGYESDTKVF